MSARRGAREAHAVAQAIVAVAELGDDLGLVGAVGQDDTTTAEALQELSVREAAQADLVERRLIEHPDRAGRTVVLLLLRAVEAGDRRELEGGPLVGEERSGESHPARDLGRTDDVGGREERPPNRGLLLLSALDDDASRRRLPADHLAAGSAEPETALGIRRLVGEFPIGGHPHPAGEIGLVIEVGVLLAPGGETEHLLHERKVDQGPEVVRAIDHALDEGLLGQAETEGAALLAGQIGLVESEAILHVRLLESGGEAHRPVVGRVKGRPLAAQFLFSLRARERDGVGEQPPLVVQQRGCHRLLSLGPAALTPAAGQDVLQPHLLGQARVGEQALEEVAAQLRADSVVDEVEQPELLEPLDDLAPSPASILDVGAPELLHVDDRDLVCHPFVPLVVCP